MDDEDYLARARETLEELDEQERRFGLNYGSNALSGLSIGVGVVTGLVGLVDRNPLVAAGGAVLLLGGMYVGKIMDNSDN